MTFTATVTAVSPGSGIPLGKVTFMDGSAELGESLLDSAGQATFTTSALDADDHAITAYYVGVPIRDALGNRGLYDHLGCCLAR